MVRKRRNTKVSKYNIAKCGNGGFTLAEVCIVLAIVAISSAMIVAFSVSMGEFLTSNTEEYEFLEDCAAVEEALHEWIAEKDGSGTSFSGTLCGRTFSIAESGGALIIDDKDVENDLHTIKWIDFYINDAGDLIKCEITRVGSDSVDKSYVFALRCANS